MAKLTAIQASLLRRISDGHVVYHNYAMGYAARMLDTGNDARWSMATLNQLFKAGCVRLPSRTDKDRRITITLIGRESLIAYELPLAPKI